MKMLNVFWMEKTVIAFLLIGQLTFEVTPASPAHIHTHHLNKEREEDGSYISRDHNHITNGEHHTEFDHEAILGSVKDAEEFDNLSPEESKRRLKILLHKMDLNRDENIDRKELHSWILRSFGMLSEEESSDRFEDADENEDGRVTWEEYKADTYGMDHKDDEDNVIHPGEDDLLIKNDKVMFDAADRNKDGILDKKEFIWFTHPEEHPEMLPFILQNTLDDKDTDKNGVINFQEFLGERAKSHSKEWLIAEKEKFDQEYDKNNDGVLNAAEILSWVVPSNEDIAEEEVTHLFAATDDDHDDLLSFDEILDNHETFVGSEATDFGEHLHNIHVFDELNKRRPETNMN